MPLHDVRSFFADRDDESQREFWASLTLRHCAGIGPCRFVALVSRFGSAYEAARHPEAWPEARVPERCARAWQQEAWRRPAQAEWAAARRYPCGILLWTDPDYPLPLRSIAAPPSYLYYRGDTSLLHKVGVAVVGMRACSAAGRRMADQLAGGLARAGVTVISGMAKGIDRAAHLAGLQACGRSIGILGTGLDVAYPSSNRDVYALMEEKGLLLSELPPGSGVDARNFPIRNRIISGLSRAVVVVEAAGRSGSLNTAKHALEQGRPLMAVPESVCAATARGCQELLRQGAVPVRDAEDVLRLLAPLCAQEGRQGVASRCPDRALLATDGATAMSPPRDSVPVSPDALFEEGGPASVGDLFSEEAGAQATPTTRRPVSAAQLSGLEGEVYALIRRSPLHVDTICRALGQDAKTISRVVVMLEVDGFIRHLFGMWYAAR